LTFDHLSSRKGAKAQTCLPTGKESLRSFCPEESGLQHRSKKFVKLKEF